MLTSASYQQLTEIPDNLRKFLKERASWSLETWSSPSIHQTTKAVEQLVDSVVRDTQEDFSLAPIPPNSSTFYRELSKKAKRSFKLIRGMKSEDISLILEDTSGNVIKTLSHRESTTHRSNQRVYENYHTKSLRRKRKVHVSSHEGGQGESENYSAVGSAREEWMVNLNEWIANFTVSYYMKGGAKKSYIKDALLRRQPLYTEQLEAKNELLSKDLIPHGEVIKVLSIGSQHNYLHRSSFRQHINVTAVDIHPADSNVFKCNFLELRIGDVNTEPIFDKGDKELIQLPAGSFDAVVISLMLSRLPTSELRVKMIRKARKLLRGGSPYEDKEKTPHYEGLLLIAEESSTFPLRDALGKVSTSKHHLPLLSMWKSGVANLGFNLMKHRVLSYAGNFHGFVFKTSNIDVSSDRSVQMVKLWSNEDFDVHSNTRMHALKVHNFNDCLDGASETWTPVSIIGGGIGGAALALALKLRNIPYLLFEKDSNINVRKQGYGLTLQQSVSGLKILGIEKDELLEHGVVSTSHFSFSSTGKLIGQYGRARKLENPIIVFSKEGNVNKDNNEIDQNVQKAYGSQRHNIHIGRQKLRELLLGRLNEESIKWGKKLESCKEDLHANSQAPITLKFSDGSIHRSLVVVAADGIYSNLRHLKSLETDTLRYLGVVVILGISDGVIKEASNGDRVQVQWLDGTTRVFCMPFDVNHTMWQLSFPIEDESEAIKISATTESLQQKALDLCSCWPYPLGDLIQSTLKSDISGHPVYDREILQRESLEVQKLTSISDMDNANKSNRNLHKNECDHYTNTMRRSKITFLGDAAHPMSPFKGQGANQAILDAVVLARSLYSSNLMQPHKQSLENALCQYEEDMMERSASKVWKSRLAVKHLHSKDALAVGNVTRASAAAMK